MLERKSFYFVRHGESEHNQRGIVAGGRIDSPLSERGITQALNLQTQIKNIGIKHVISSSLLRARKTSEIAWDGILHIDVNLREFELGIFEGKEDIGISEYVLNLPYDVPVPQGESKKVFVERITNSINKWLITLESPLLFVGHGFMWGFLLLIMKIPIYNEDGTLIKDLENCKLTHFQPSGTGWKVTYL